jgi:hypothetical protein
MYVAVAMAYRVTVRLRCYDAASPPQPTTHPWHALKMYAMVTAVVVVYTLVVRLRYVAVAYTFFYMPRKTIPPMSFSLVVQCTMRFGVYRHIFVDSSMLVIEKYNKHKSLQLTSVAPNKLNKQKNKD